MLVNGDVVSNLSARAAISRGVAHIPEDRLGEGLVGNGIKFTESGGVTLTVSSLGESDHAVRHLKHDLAGSNRVKRRNLEPPLIVESD